MPEIRLAIAGVGNCASSLVQGLAYYTRRSAEKPVGLMHETLAGYALGDIKIVAAFDIDARKVGRDVAEAVFAPPNCTKVFEREVPATGVKVQMAPVLDGVSPHMSEVPPERTFVVADEEPVDVPAVLRATRADVLINYMPVGSEAATRSYAEAALASGTAFVNCMPVFIASDAAWGERFARAKVPIVGDDIKSQFGATITHRVLTKLMADRGVKLKHTYQLNFGGNTDFLNMLNRERLKSKKISKTQSVQSQLEVPLSPQDIHIGPSDYVPWLDDNKVCMIRMEGEGWGGVPLELEMRLSVEDSPNSAGVAIDAIRCAKVALDRGVGGPLKEISSYTMKSPPVQYSDSVAHELVEAWIGGTPTQRIARKVRSWASAREAPARKPKSP